ncbi:MAG: hypothetical protein ABSD62_03550 [Candidatus Limnocylindrales bacterium]|jgi:hypothetical protein
MASIVPSHSTHSPSSERSSLENRLEGLDGHHAAAPQLGFMLAGAQWRDSWLHGFRSLYLVMEVILLGLAGGLLVSILTLEVSRAWVPAVLLLVDATGSLLLLVGMRRAAIGLGDDVRFWHREIVRAERELPPERRVFTRFKLLQRSRNHSDTGELAAMALSETGLDEIGLDRLIEPFSATRRLIENRVPTLIAVLWVSWALAGIGALCLRLAHVIG